MDAKTIIKSIIITYLQELYFTRTLKPMIKIKSIKEGGMYITLSLSVYKVLS